MLTQVRFKRCAAQRWYTAEGTFSLIIALQPERAPAIFEALTPKILTHAAYDACGFLTRNPVPLRQNWPKLP